MGYITTKTGEGYITVPRAILHDKNGTGLPDCAILTYLWLCEAEQHFAAKNRSWDRDWFYCTDAQLAQYADKNIKTIQKGKKILEENGYIRTWRGGEEYARIANSKYIRNGKYPTCYRIIR